MVSTDARQNAIGASRVTGGTVLLRSVPRGATPPTPVRNKPSRPPYYSISMESPISVKNDRFPGNEDAASSCELSFPPTRIRVASFFAWVGPVWFSSILESLPIRFGFNWLGNHSFACWVAGVTRNIDLSRGRPFQSGRQTPWGGTLCCRYYGRNCRAQRNPYGCLVGCGYPGIVAKRCVGVPV